MSNKMILDDENPSCSSQPVWIRPKGTMGYAHVLDELVQSGAVAAVVFGRAFAGGLGP